MTSDSRLKLFTEQSLSTAAAAAATGCAGALALSRTRQSVVYGMNAGDTSSILLAVVVLLAVTVVAALIPAMRATRIDPVRVWRSE